MIRLVQKQEIILNHFREGKSHMAIGLGIKAVNAGHKVLFTTIPLLVNELKECRSEKPYGLLKIGLKSTI